MRDRLIGLIEKKQVYGIDQKQKRNDELLLLENEELADHLLANGVIVPPCKVGDVVWWTDGCTKFTHLVEVTRITYTKEYGFDISGFTRKLKHKIFNEEDIGKTVFLTKEQAEKALAERGEGE